MVLGIGVDEMDIIEKNVLLCLFCLGNNLLYHLIANRRVS